MTTENRDNFVWCQSITRCGVSNTAALDEDSPNILCCEHCETRYALFRETSLCTTDEQLWHKQVMDLRAAVTQEHTGGHKSLVFSHNGKVATAVHRRPRFGRWLR